MSALTDSLDDYIGKVRADWDYVGTAVAVVHGEDVIYARGFGAREIGKPGAIDPGTLFQVGSTTKAFAAAALGILVDEGRMGWDDAVIEHLPAFRLRDPWLTEKLTVRDALAHRSGVPVSFYPFVQAMSADEAIRQLRYVAPEGAFRDSFLYNNLLYGAAGQIVEAVSGMAWGDFVRQRLFNPLRMSRSGASPFEFWDKKDVATVFFGLAAQQGVGAEAARDANVAMPHVWAETGTIRPLAWQSYDVAAAAGSMVSTAADMANWLILHLNEGRFGAQQILSGDTVRELHATQNLHAGDKEFLFPLNETTEGYALGWWRGRYRGHVHLSHSGGIIGFPAYVAFLPEMRAGVVVLSNGPKVANSAYLLEYLFHKAIAFSVFDRLLQAEGRDWSAELSSRMRKGQEESRRAEQKLRASRLSLTVPSLSPEHYEGCYVENGGGAGRIAVTAEKGELSLSFAGENGYAAVLEHWHRDVFLLRPRPGVPDVMGLGFVGFDITPAGEVRALTVNGAFGGAFCRSR